jgi:hypothetical protein
VNIDQAIVKAINNNMTTISLDDKPFVSLVGIKRTDAQMATKIRIVLSKRRAKRIHFFMSKYAKKITIIDTEQQS